MFFEEQYRLEVRHAARDAGYGDDVPEFVRDEALALHKQIVRENALADELDETDYKRAICEFPRCHDSQVCYVRDLLDDVAFDFAAPQRHPSLSARERNV